MTSGLHIILCYCYEYTFFSLNVVLQVMVIKCYDVVKVGGIIYDFACELHLQKNFTKMHVQAYVKNFS